MHSQYPSNYHIIYRKIIHNSTFPPFLFFNGSTTTMIHRYNKPIIPNKPSLISKLFVKLFIYIDTQLTKPTAIETLRKNGLEQYVPTHSYYHELRLTTYKPVPTRMRQSKNILHTKHPMEHRLHRLFPRPFERPFPFSLAPGSRYGFPSSRYNNDGTNTPGISPRCSAEGVEKNFLSPRVLGRSIACPADKPTHRESSNKDNEKLVSEGSGPRAGSPVVSCGPMSFLVVVVIVVDSVLSSILVNRPGS